MPQTPEHEDRNVCQYVISQLHDDEDEVTLVQRVGQERVAGNRYLMYDVHTVKGRWWVVTNPTNLYDQKTYPELDYVLSFHIGLQMRVFERGRVEVDPELQEHAEGAWRRYSAAVEALNTADDAEDFQAVGVKCREALLALARENSGAEWVGEVAEPPKGDDLKGWIGVFAVRLLPDRRQRAYLKDVAEKTWDIVVGLQHNTNATPWDAELTLAATGHLLNTFMLARVKFERGEPARCPRCSSYRLVPDGEVDEVDAEPGYAEWTTCAACNWTSEVSFESFRDWDDRVGDRARDYLAEGPEKRQPPAPRDGFENRADRP